MHEWLDQIERAVRGDVDAFGEIVAQFQRHAWACAFALLKDAHLAEDAAQDAFQEAFEKLGKLREHKAFPAWLNRIVVGRCHRFMRKNRPVEQPLALGQDPARAEPMANAILCREEERRAALSALLGLPDAERHVAMLFYLAECSQQEVAAFLDLPVSTVNNRLHTARKVLKERMLSMNEDASNTNEPGESFTARVTKAIQTYSTKGPERDMMHSEWRRERMKETNDILRAGDDGFVLSVTLSQSPLVRVRREAAAQFGLRKDPRGIVHLKRLMVDPNARVREHALRALAFMIFPEEDGPVDYWGASGNWLALHARSVSDHIESIIGRIDDDNLKVRWYAVLALGPYAATGDHRIKAALEHALHDSKHKVRHAAALRLGIACPDCGASARASANAP